MYTYIAYHGTDLGSAESISRSNRFNPSKHDGLWLGEGIYFFEAGPRHALSWTENKCAGTELTPVVLEARIEAESVINLCDKKHWALVKEIYELLREESDLRDQIGPEGLFSEVLRGDPRMFRNTVDHAVMDTLIASVNRSLLVSRSTVDLVRCPFIGGREVYLKSWFFTRSCLMLNIRNPACIKDAKNYTRLTLLQRVLMTELNQPTGLASSKHLLSSRSLMSPARHF